MPISYHLSIVNSETCLSSQVSSSRNTFPSEKIFPNPCPRIFFKLNSGEVISAARPAAWRETSSDESAGSVSGVATRRGASTSTKPRPTKNDRMADKAVIRIVAHRSSSLLVIDVRDQGHEPRSLDRGSEFALVFRADPAAFA